MNGGIDINQPTNKETDTTNINTKYSAKMFEGAI